MVPAAPPVLMPCWRPWVAYLEAIQTKDAEGGAIALRLALMHLRDQWLHVAFDEEGDSGTWALAVLGHASEGIKILEEDGARDLVEVRRLHRWLCLAAWTPCARA